MHRYKWAVRTSKRVFYFKTEDEAMAKAHRLRDREVEIKVYRPGPRGLAGHWLHGVQLIGKPYIPHKSHSLM